MFDVFYFGPKPNLFEFERPADSLEHAAQMATTGFYWYIYGGNDYQGFNFDYHPVPWESNYTHVWGDQHQANGNVYLTSNPYADFHYHKETVHRLGDISCWQIPTNIDQNSVDYRWSPDTASPPYIYHFPSQHQSASGVMYVTPGATEVKLVDSFVVSAMPSPDNWQIPTNIDSNRIDFSWHPNPLDPPYIYHFPSQHQSASGVVYLVPGATEVKLIDSIKVTALPVIANWYIPDNIDSNRIDFSWHPNPLDPPYIYHFPSQHQSASGVMYVTLGATEVKLVDAFVVNSVPTTDNWQIPTNIDSTSIDFSWHPNPIDPPYIYHFPSQHQSASGVMYVTPGATEVKLIDSIKVTALPVIANWYIPDNIVSTSIDFSWHPNPIDPPYIYHFPSQHQSASGVMYVTPGATEVKLIDSFVVSAMPSPEKFTIMIPVAQFDWSWHPNPLDPPYNYIFGNQWNSATIEATVVYSMTGSDENKYMDQTAIVAADLSNWHVLDEIVDFDYSWRPNPTEPPYRYIFGNQWLTPEQRPALEYLVANAVEVKYMPEPRATRISTPERFVNHYDSEFDYSWEPDPGSPPYNYVFGNQWHSAEIMPTVELRMLGATETKFIDQPRAKLLEHHDNRWHTIVDCEWDYSWRPEPGSPPLIFVFGNQHWSSIKMPTVEYHMPGASQRKFMDYPTAKLLPNKDNWNIPEEVAQDNIDFSWVPDPNEQPFIHHFGTDYQQSVGLTYTVPGATEYKFTGFMPKIVKEARVITVLDIFFVDKNNDTATTRFECLRAKYPNIQKVRYANSMLDTINRCVNRSKTGKFWVISSEYDYTNFDFAWHAEPWQNYMTHVFPSQHQKWSDTFLINKWEFQRHSQWANGIEQFPNLNFVSNQVVIKPENLHTIYYVDHGNGTIARHQYEYLRDQNPDMVITRFVSNYLDTFKRIMATADTEYVWIINSICDYTKFDFTWQPEPWQKEMIHVFKSDHTKEGDTFYIHVESFKQQMYDLDLLDWFNVINYIDEPRVHRFETPIHFYQGDNLIQEIQNYKFDSPYVYFTKDKERYGHKLQAIVPDFKLWSEQDRTVNRYNSSGSSVLVPKEIKQHLKTQLYDYPYIKKIHDTKTDQSLSIVYISNGEPEEQRWYEHTKKIAGIPVAWSKGVNGRTAAYQAAARMSQTPWFFLVFAKLEVVEDFDWTWQPDYFQEPKHYIFNSRNPVNGLEYGHMGVIAYNKQLVLGHNSPGIDFTLSQPHESVPILSGIAHFNQDAWTTWRTAFRETLKLKYFMATNPTLETQHRLNVWINHATGNFAEDCLTGARDAVEYYDLVDGDYEKLKLSYDWKFLRDLYEGK